MRKVFLFQIVAFGATGLGLNAQETKGPTGKSGGRAAITAPAPAARGEDEKAIKALLDAFTKGFDAGDAKAVAATYTETAVVIDEGGERIEGRAAVRDQYAAYFADHPGGKIAIQVDSLRFLGPETALEEGRATITPAAGAGAPRSPASPPFTSSKTASGGRPPCVTSSRTTSPPTTTSRSWSGSSATGSTRARTRSSPPPASGPRAATSSIASSP